MANPTVLPEVVTVPPVNGLAKTMLVSPPPGPPPTGVPLIIMRPEALMSPCCIPPGTVPLTGPTVSPGPIVASVRMLGEPNGVVRSRMVVPRAFVVKLSSA